MRHLTLTLVHDGEATRGSKAEGGGRVKNPMPAEKEQSGAVAATTHAPPREVIIPDLQCSMESGTGSRNYLPETLLVRGEIEGRSDLTVDGRVDGPINLGKNSLTVGRAGQVNGNIQASNVTILGGVVGNVVATERVEITDTGRLIGGICAPRICVSDGAHFEGRVDMASFGQADVRRQGLALPAPTQQEHTGLEVPVPLNETAL